MCFAAACLDTPRTVSEYNVDTDGKEQYDLVRGRGNGDLCFEYSNTLLITTLLP